MGRQSQEAVQRRLNGLERKLESRNFREKFKSITVDNGTEFLDSHRLETSVYGEEKRTEIYYANAYSAWERGSNENLYSFIPRKRESKLQKALDAVNKLIARLKAEIASLKQELSEYKSVHGKLRTLDQECGNAELRGKVQRYEDVIQHNNLGHFFRPRREKVATRNDAR